MSPLGVIELLHLSIAYVFQLIGIEVKTHNDLNIWLNSGGDWVVRFVASSNEVNRF